jgi:hypothetical protein
MSKSRIITDSMNLNTKENSTVFIPMVNNNERYSVKITVKNTVIVPKLKNSINNILNSVSP